MRRNARPLVPAALTALVATALAAGCSGKTATVYAPATPGVPLWSAGAGDTLGSGSFERPVVIAAYEARQIDDTAFAAVPTD